jgi:hypothetical protein
MRRGLGCGLAILLLTVPTAGQMAHRLKGSIRSTAGVPLAGATVRGDALTGFRGEPFAGAKEQSATSLPSGEWNITNLEAGLWMFSTTAPDMLPAVMVIPVKFSQRQQVSAVGNALTWQLPLWAIPANQAPMLKVAAELVAAGKNDDGMQALTVALGPDISDDTRIAAGEMALLVRNPALAKMIFNLVLQKDPKHARAKLGLSSALLMGLEWEAAGKVLWDARDLAQRELRPALAAGIDDLRGIARIQ